MSKAQQLTGHPFQHITVTMQLTGTPQYTLASHGDGTGAPGSQITVASGDTLIYLHDRYAVHAYAAAWLTRHAIMLADRLPETSPLPDSDRAGLTVTLAIHATGRDQAFVRPDAGGIRVTIGKVTWICRDKQAFTGQQHIWHTALQLAAVVLPEHDLERLAPH